MPIRGPSAKRKKKEKKKETKKKEASIADQKSRFFLVSFLPFWHDKTRFPAGLKFKAESGWTKGIVCLSTKSWQNRCTAFMLWNFSDFVLRSCLCHPFDLLSHFSKFKFNDTDPLWSRAAWFPSINNAPRAQEWMSERCERMSEWKSEWPSTYIWILGCSAP